MKSLRLINGSSTVSGGGLRVASAGTEVLVRNCGISNSHADSNGGGVFVEAGTLSMINSTVSGNDADGNGGGLHSNTGATLNLVQSTVSDNSAIGNGGGLFVVGGATVATLINNTIAENTADSDADGIGDGGGIRRAGGTVNLATASSRRTPNSSVVAASSFDDVSGAFATLGHNLIGKDDGSTGLVDGTSGDIVGTSASPKLPGIGSLALNGGDTRTHRLLNASQARDAGDDALLADPTWPAGIPNGDQRGQSASSAPMSISARSEWPDGQLVRIEVVDATMNEWLRIWHRC